MDDCIAAAVEGNRQYAELLSSNPGVGAYCTPMWASVLNYGDRETKRYNIEHRLKPKSFGDNLIDWGFSKIAWLDTGLNFISDFEVESMVGGFAKSYNFGVVKLYGNAKIAERCYRQAKEEMSCSPFKNKP